MDAPRESPVWRTCAFCGREESEPFRARCTGCGAPLPETRVVTLRKLEAQQNDEQRS